MSFWKSIFGKRDNEEIPEFRGWVVKSIRLIGTDGGQMEDDELRDFLVKNGIPKFDADEIILFLPVAFCRKLLPEIDWPPSYIDFYSELKQVRKKYQDNWRYKIITEETERFWKDNLENSIVLNIAGRSAEFKAINDALNNGSKLENLQLLESRVIRYE